MNARPIFRAALIVGALGAILWSCAKLQDSLPTKPSIAGGHPTGWADTASANFHEKSIRSTGFHIDSCAQCHGTTLTGGAAPSCDKSGCHAEADNGPRACYNCHGDRVKKSWYPPRALNGSTDESYVGVGQHRGHMEDTTISNHVFKKCTTCHAMPDEFAAPSHIDGTTATITFGDSLAFKRTNVQGGYKYSDSIPTVTPAPHWDATTQSCQNVYCHGSFKNGNVNNAPKWTGDEQDACGSCHGDPVSHNPLPGGTHPKRVTCSTCHDGVVDDNNNIIDRSLHIDGKLNFLGDNYDVW